MKYIALLRGINAGKNRRVEMKKLKLVFEAADCINVSTYINSGNVIFESDVAQDTIQLDLEKAIEKTFGFQVPTLIKTEKEILKIARAIPSDWQNDTKQRTDVAYLFKEIDSKNILNELPFQKEFIDVRYVTGAVIWNIDRENYNKSHLNKLIGHELYPYITMRNVNTARYLAGIK